jgi:DNA phosphorothioation-dependent restriction protein DptG
MAQRQTNKRKRKRANQRIQNLARSAQGQARKIGQEYHNAAVTGLEASSRSVSEFNKGLQEITDEMTDYSKQSLEEVVRAWQQFLDARLFGRLLEIQNRYIQNAYEAYASEASRVGELYLGLARRVAEPIEKVTRRSR